ncbi:hypothetical protein [Silvibacterium acidisoli]|uniref:hypothetical protein n=1 Tax=Acidobacteriaceae bacterium ZG23-2 TaxID=2883246 RepID=UPI00406C241B
MNRNLFITRVFLPVAVLATALCWWSIFRFGATPGGQLNAPGHLPAAAPFHATGAPVLLVFVHPGCTCTHATLEELDDTLNGYTKTLQVVLVVYHSAATERAGLTLEFTPRSWLHRDFRVVSDDKGMLSKQFGVQTSGEIVLYGRNGQMLFQGGVTPERAHVGASKGRDALERALFREDRQGGMTQVFGCPIFQ